MGRQEEREWCEAVDRLLESACSQYEGPTSPELVPWEERPIDDMEPYVDSYDPESWYISRIVRYKGGPKDGHFQAMSPPLPQVYEVPIFRDPHTQVSLEYTPGAVEFQRAVYHLTWSMFFGDDGEPVRQGIYVYDCTTI